VKIVHIETLISRGRFPGSAEWRRVRKHLHLAIKAVDWPVGSGKFTIYPESGKKRGEGNGVTPIKCELMAELQRFGWRLQERLEVAAVQQPGKLDAVFYSKQGPIAFEWETGNISSSHRALNKMALGLLKGRLAAGILVVPSRTFSQYLTDRIGNFPELAPYCELWSSIPCNVGLLEVIVVEHDATSTMVPKIPKATDGRARG
jgi:hypothetical protein